MVTLKDIYWMAGILDGEGCFSIHNKVYKRKTGYKAMSTPIIDIGSTDRDTIVKVASLFYSPISVQSIRVMKNARGNFQKYSTKIYSSRAIGWMMTIYSLMSTRRKKRIKDIIESWKLEKRRCVTRIYLRGPNAGKIT